MKRLFLVLFFTLVMVSSVNAQSTLALQEKCVEGAKKFFFNSEKVNPFASPKRELGMWSDDGGYGTTQYMSHYNKKLDRCFILIESQYRHTWESRRENIPAKREYRHITQALFNVFEGKEVAVLDQMSDDKNTKIQGDLFLRCYVGTERCKLLEEFETLIKPYMEE